MIVFVVHFNKAEDLSISNRTSGAKAFREVPRSVLLILPDRQQPGRTLMIQDKRNKLAADALNATAFRTRRS